MIGRLMLLFRLLRLFITFFRSPIKLYGKAGLFLNTGFSHPRCPSGLALFDHNQKELQSFLSSHTCEGVKFVVVSWFYTARVYCL